MMNGIKSGKPLFFLWANIKFLKTNFNCAKLIVL